MTRRSQETQVPYQNSTWTVTSVNQACGLFLSANTMMRLIRTEGGCWAWMNSERY